MSPSRQHRRVLRNATWPHPPNHNGATSTRRRAPSSLPSEMNANLQPEARGAPRKVKAVLPNTGWGDRVHALIAFVAWGELREAGSLLLLWPTNIHWMPVGHMRHADVFRHFAISQVFLRPSTCNDIPPRCCDPSQRRERAVSAGDLNVGRRPTAGRAAQVAAAKAALGTPRASPATRALRRR